jgi:YgiT-type zinc finger domain-containing protein
MGIEYGRCPCTGRYERREVEVRMTVQGRMVVVAGVPQGACPTCGSRIYKAEILARIEALMAADPEDPRLVELSRT